MRYCKDCQQPMPESHFQEYRRHIPGITVAEDDVKDRVIAGYRAKLAAKEQEIARLQKRLDYARKVAAFLKKQLGMYAPEYYQHRAWLENLKENEL